MTANDAVDWFKLLGTAEGNWALIFAAEFAILFLFHINLRHKLGERSDCSAIVAMIKRHEREHPPRMAQTKPRPPAAAQAIVTRVENELRELEQAQAPHATAPLMPTANDRVSLLVKALRAEYPCLFPDG